MAQCQGGEDVAELGDSVGEGSQEAADTGMIETNISETSGDDFVGRDELQQYGQTLAKKLSWRRKRVRETLLRFMESVPQVQDELAADFAPFEFIRGDDVEVVVVDIIVRKVRDVFKVSYKSRFSIFVDDYAKQLSQAPDDRKPWPVKYKPDAKAEQVLWCVGPSRPPHLIKDPTEAINRLRAMSPAIKVKVERYERMPALPSLDLIPGRPLRRATRHGGAAVRRLHHSVSSSSATSSGTFSSAAAASSASTVRRAMSAWDLGTSMPRPIGLGPPDEGFRECAMKLTEWSCGQARHAPMELRTPGPGAYESFWSSPTKRTPCIVNNLSFRHRFETKKSAL